MCIRQKAQDSDMLSIKILLFSVIFPAGTWAAWANMHQSHLIIQMVFGILISLGIFFAVLCTSEYETFFPLRMNGRPGSAERQRNYLPKVPSASTQQPRG
jgi:hypothetical protein